jgi:hypothetical protein
MRRPAGHPVPARNTTNCGPRARRGEKSDVKVNPRLPRSDRTDYYAGSMGSDGACAYAEGVVEYGAETKKVLQVIKVVNQFQAILSGLRRSAQLRLRSHWVDSGHCPGALAIMAEGPGRDALQMVFREAGWKLMIAETSAPALDPRTERLPIILYERELNPCHWREAVSLLSGLSPRPYVILLSSRSDKNLWDELVRHGGSDILRTPIDRDTVVRAVKSGWSLWRNQQRLRLAAEARS